MNIRLSDGGRRLLALLLLISSLSPFAAAQSVAARVAGTVTDPTSAAVPGATVTAADTATGRTVSATSGVDGRYLLYPLPPGIYDLTIEAPGMRTARIEQLQLYANDNAVRNARLEVGALAQEVTVSAAALAVNASPSVESTITEEQVQNLPLNGRDYNQLVLLGAGAVDPPAGVSYDLGSVAVNGNRAYSNSYLVDGASNTSTWQNTSAISLSVGVIREFKVISGVAPAEYGNGSTSIVMVTKSGGNQFHGSLFEYHRGNTFITRDPFTFTPPAAFSRNQFGGSVGGPVRLPRYNGRNRTFFFANYEASRQAGGATRVTTVPPDDFWKGDFSSLLPRVQLRDPLTAGRPPIPDNRLDLYLGGARMDPVALKLRPVFAKATKPGLVNNSVLAVDATSLNDQFSGRVDHVLPHNQLLSARVTYSNSRGYTPGMMGLPDLGYQNPSRALNGMLGWTANAGAATVNEFRLGVSSFKRSINYVSGGYPTGASAGMQGLVPEDPSVAPTPIISFSGADTFSSLSYFPGGGQGTTNYANNVYTLSEVISTVRGRHQIKAGFDGRRTLLNFLLVNNGQGNVQFNGATNNNSSGYSFADFLMGVVYTSAHSPKPAKVLLTQPEFAFFAQDDWRIARNLTLTFGVRNETFYHAAEERNRMAMFTPDLGGGGIVVACADGKLPVEEFNGGVMSRLVNAAGNLTFPMACASSLGYNSRRLVDNKPWNLGPRAGLSWDPDGRGNWMIHSGYGTFYSRYPQQYVALTVNNNPPFASIFNYQQSLVNFVPALTLRSPYLASGTPNLTPYGIERNFRLPDNQQWNFTIQRMLGRNSVFSVAYLGNKGTHLFRSVNMNMQSIDPATGLLVRRYATVFGGAVVSYEMTNANSTYHALQTEVRRRFAGGLGYQVNWTWAKGIDDVGFNATTTMLDLQNLGRDRANSDYTRRHQINSNFTWDVPVGRGKRFGGAIPGWLNTVAGGWRLSGIWRYTTGRYLTPSYTPPGSFASNNRPDVVYGVSSSLPRSERGQARWFNPAAFAVPPTLDPETGQRRYGNAGRNIVVGPGFSRLDGSINKSFKVGRESRRIVGRLDLFNIANHPNWGNPAMNISSVNTVGSISSVNGSMRQAQFSVEFQF